MKKNREKMQKIEKKMRNLEKNREKKRKKEKKCDGF